MSGPVSISIEESLYKRLHAYALHHDISLEEALDRVLVHSLPRPDSHERPPNRVRIIEEGGPHEYVPESQGIECVCCGGACQIPVRWTPEDGQAYVRCGCPEISTAA